MLDSCPLVLSPTGQSGLRFKVIIFSTVLLVHGVVLGVAWMHRIERQEQKIFALPEVSFFESYVLQSQLSEAMTTRPANTPNVITPVVITRPEESLPNTEYQRPTANHSDPHRENLTEANESKKVSGTPNHRHAASGKHKHKPDLSEPSSHASSPHNEILPSSHAHYLTNPQPPYPKKSRRLGEQGKVLLAVEVDRDGRVSQILLSLSSGHPRLDRSALEAIRSWRFTPGKRGGTSQKMWVNIPINFVLE